MKKSVAFGVIGVVFILVFCIVMLRFLFTTNDTSFTNVLTLINNVPTYDLGTIDYLIIGGNWGSLLDPLRQFFNILLYPISVLVWLGKNLYNFIIYCFYFIRFIFVGV